VERASVSTKILVVEDDRYSREGLRELLLSAGHTVQIYGDARQAVQLARTYQFDSALVDLDLPRERTYPLTGWDLIQALRECDPSLPIVVITAEERSRALYERAAALNVAEVLGKPISPRYLKGVVRALGARTGGLPAAAGAMPTKGACQPCVCTL
jgi:DNA-binding response OmpR family regulator